MECYDEADDLSPCEFYGFPLVTHKPKCIKLLHLSQVVSLTNVRRSGVVPAYSGGATRDVARLHIEHSLGLIEQRWLSFYGDVLEPVVLPTRQETLAPVRA